MKKITAIGLALVFLMLCGLSAAEEGETGAVAWDTVLFGSYPQTAEGADRTPIEWIVLDYDEANHKAFLLSRYGLDVEPYNTEQVSIFWEDCTLRAWLNDEFLNRAFSAEEQSAILTTDVDNSVDSLFTGEHVDGSNNTQDRIFLLSYAEVYRYLDIKNWTEGDYSNTKSRVAPTAYAVSKGASEDESNLTADGEPAGWWWLRAPSNYIYVASCVGFDGAYYNVSDYSRQSGTYAVVRPAFWLDLESSVFQSENP